MKYRGRLVLAAVASCVAGVVLGLLLAPFASILLIDLLHVGCDLSSDGASASWICPDGVGYALGALTGIAALTGLIFMVSVVLIVRRHLRQDGSPNLPRAVARDLGWAGAAPLVVQTPFSVLAWMFSDVSFRAVIYGLIVGIIGLAPFITFRASRWRYVAACLAASAAAPLVTSPAALAAPFLVAFAALLLTAAAVSTIGGNWQSRMPDERSAAAR